MKNRQQIALSRTVASGRNNVGKAPSYLIDYLYYGSILLNLPGSPSLCMGINGSPEGGEGTEAQVGGLKKAPPFGRGASPDVWWGIWALVRCWVLTRLAALCIMHFGQGSIGLERQAMFWWGCRSSRAIPMIATLSRSN